MKVVTWNVNSIHARLDNVLNWVEANDPDILLLQETKVVDQEFPIDDFGDLGYDCVFTGERSYNGVAICAKDEIHEVRKNLPGDGPEAQKRLIAGRIGALRVASVYVPNGQALDSDKYPFKLDWLARLRAYLPELTRPDQPFLISGDYNIAPADLDVWDTKAMAGSTHVSPPERAALAALQEFGLVDAFRLLEPNKRQYSWWDYRAGCFQRDVGLRIDLHLVSQALVPRVRKVTIDTQARAEEKASDHAPVILELSDA